MYLDPVFGSMVVQVIVLAIACGGVVLFALRKKLRLLFSKKKKLEVNSAGGESAYEATDEIIDTMVDDAASIAPEETADKETD